MPCSGSLLLPLFLQSPGSCIDNLSDTLHNKNRAALQTIIEGNPSLAQMLRLITSIKGIGTFSGVQIIAVLPDLNNFENVRALGAYAGVTPRHFQSGTSGKARTPTTKTGSKHLY
jgi:transposase